MRRKQKKTFQEKKQRRIQWKPVYLLIVLAVLASAMIAGSLRHPERNGIAQRAVRFVVVPVQKCLNRIGIPFHSENRMPEEDLQKENAMLRDRIQELEQEQFRYEKGQKELERLRKLYQLNDNYEQYDTTAARVIGKTDGNWFSTFLIDKGARDGIEKNMNVVCPEGLVGYVSNVYDTYAKVTTILDESSSVSAEFLEAEALCMVNGSLQQIRSGTLPITNIDAEAEAKKNDTVVTSQISSKYIPGIKIGTAGEITPDDTGLSQVSTLVPAVNFRNIHEVLIIKAQKEPDVE